MSGGNTKADDVALELEHAIVSGELAPGTVLRQDRLSEQSASAARRSGRRCDAWRRSARLVEPDRGVASAADPRGTARGVLDPGRAGEPRDRDQRPSGARADLDELEAIEDRFAGLAEELRRGGRLATTAAPTSSPSRYMPNHAFHDVIPRVAALPMLERIAKGTAAPSCTLWAPSDAGELDELYGANERQHRALLDALAAGSPSGARALAREHVLSSGALLERILAQQLGSDTERNIV